MKYRVIYLNNGGNNIRKIDLNDIEKVDTIDDINTNLLIKYKDYEVYKKDNIIELYHDYAHLTKFHLYCDCENNYRNYFGYIKLFIEFLKSKYNLHQDNLGLKVYMMGFGIGGIPLLLSEFKGIDVIDCVDIDKDLFRIYKTVIENPPKKINLFHSDIIKYLEEGEFSDHYDIIMDDVFIKTRKIEYDFEPVYKALKKGGCFLLNIHFKDQVDNMIKKLEKLGFVNINYEHNNEYLLYCQK